MHDIQNPEDVRLLVDDFYRAIRADTLLNPIFTHVAKVDWDQHLPKMYAFWDAMILGRPGYSGRPFPAHAVLPLKREHFQRWLALFNATVSRNFTGVTAKATKDLAASIARTFATRMGLADPVSGS